MFQTSKIQVEVLCWRKNDLQSATAIIKSKQKFWFTNHCTTIVWVFFVLNNLLEKALLGATQTMRHALIAMSPNKFKVQTTPLMSARAFSPTIQCMTSSMKKHIDNEHEAIVAKYVLHPKSENKASGPSHEKCKKHKQAALSAIIEFFRMFNLTKVLIPFSYSSLKT